MESEEMKPRWWGFDDVPFEKMWADDPLWFPYLLAGQLFAGDVVFTDKTTMASHSVVPVDAVDESPWERESG